MNDFNKFVSPQPHDPYEDIRINPIESNKKRREEPYTGLPPSLAPPMVLASLMHVLKKSLDAFFEADANTSLLDNPQQLLDTVLNFKNHLQELVEEDLSHTPRYTQQLSTSWHSLRNDCHFLLAHVSPLPDYVEKTHRFLETLFHYPEEQDHPLGYYLTAFAGEHWIPFPFMDILKKLHEECQTTPQTAMLIQWIMTLSEILSE